MTLSIRLALLLLACGCGRVHFDPAVDAELVIGPSAPIRIAAGGKTSCLRQATGVVCWGLGNEGNLGDGDPSNHTSVTPVQVVGTGAVVELDVNDPGALGRTAEGNVVGWGNNVFGNLASGTTGIQAAAVPMLGISDATTVTLAYDTACVADTAGAVRCAGNSLRLGDGSTVDRGELGLVPISDVVQLTGGDTHVCALRRDGSASCWGSNDVGQLGDGSFAESRVPTAGPVGPYTAIGAGDTHVCALTLDRHVDCWGNNSSGELGDGTLTSSPTPVRVLGVDDATAIMVTAVSACALHGDGGVSCWGSNRNGELAVSTSTLFRPSAERIALTEIVELSGRTAIHACAIKTDRTVWCWGNNEFSQLGHPASGIESVPLQVPGLLAD